MSSTATCSTIFIATGVIPSKRNPMTVMAPTRSTELRGCRVRLTTELVTNAIRHEVTGIVMLAITCSYGQLRVDVHDTSCCLPMLVEAAADDEAGRGLMLVTTMSEEWGFYRTPAGKAVYFTLAFAPDVAEGNGRGPQGVHAWGL